MKKFSFKSIAFLMSLIMVFSIFAPVVASAKEYVHEHDKDGVLNYVSIGDSMTNGFGLDGYYVSAEEKALWAELDPNREIKWTPNDADSEFYGYQVYGYLQEVPTAYPALFRDYLADKHKCEVDLTQLATSSLRAEDIWYLMTFDPETEEAAWDGDGYSYLRDVNNAAKFFGNENVAYSGYNVSELAAQYQAAITNADVISLAVGPNNFATYFTVAFLEDLLKDYSTDGVVNEKIWTDKNENGSIDVDEGEIRDYYYTEPEWDYIKEHLDAATEKDLEELFEDLGILSNGVFADMEGMFPDEMFAGRSIEDVMKFFAERLVYTTISFTIAYRGILEEIKKLNPDAEIITVNMENWLEDVVFNFGGFELPVGDLLQNVYDFANDFMALSAAFYENQEDCELNFYYADITNKEYTMIIEDLYNALENNASVEDTTRVVIIEGMDGMDVGSMIGNGLDAEMIIGSKTKQGYLAPFRDYDGDGVKETTREYYMKKLDEKIYGDNTYLECILHYGAVIEALKVLAGTDDTIDLDNIDFLTFAKGVAVATGPDGMAFDADKAMAVYNQEDANEVLAFVTSLAGGEYYVAEMYVTFEMAMSKCGKDKYFTASNVSALFNAGSLMADKDADDEDDITEDGVITAIMKEYISQPSLTVGYWFYADNMSELFYENDLLRELFFAYGTLLVGWGLACHPSENGHEDVCEAMVDAYEGKYTATDAAMDALKGYADKAYAYAYSKLVAEGKIDAAIAGLEAAIDGVNAAIDAVEALPENNQKALIIAELENTVATLEKVITLLETGDLDTAWATLLTFEEDFYAHLETLKELAISAGYDIDPYLVKAYNALAYYATVINDLIDTAYDYAQKINDTAIAINDAYLALVDCLGDIADKIDPALGAAVRAYIIDTPADVLAIIYAYGEEAVIKLITDAANATGEIYEVVLGLAALLENYGEEIVDIVTSKDEFNALLNEIADTNKKLEEVYNDLKADDIIKDKIAQLKDKLAELENDALNAPLSTDYEEMKAEINAEIVALSKALVGDYADKAYAAADILKAELKDLYAALCNLVEASIDEVDPLVGDMLMDSITALIEALEIAENTGVEYAEWLQNHFKPLAGELLASIIGNTEEFVGVAYPIIEALVIKILKEVNEFLGNLAEDLKDFVYGLEDEFEAIKALIAKLEKYLDETNDLLGELLGVAEGNLIDKLKVLAENMDEIKASILKDLEAFIDTGLYADYVTDADSFYLAITAMAADETHYAALLAEKLGVPAGVLANGLRVSDIRALLDADYVNDAYGTSLFELVDVDAIRTAYVEAIAMSDLITLDLGAADFTTFTTQQLLGFVVEQNKATLEELLDMMGDSAAFIDLSYFQAYELDWARFGDFVDFVDVEAILAEVEAKLVEEGLPAEYKVVLTAEDLGIQLPSIVTQAPEFTLTLYPAETVMYAVECYLYAFVNYAYNYGATIDAIHAINPDAEVVVLGTFNAFEGLVIDLGDYVIDMTEIGDKVVAAMDAYALANVLAKDNTTFVDIKDVETVLDAADEKTVLDFVSLETLGFNADAFTATADGHAYIAEQILKALTVTCAHAYDNVCDADCNICGEEREVGAHEYDNACDVDCNKCGEVREVPAHVYDNACDADCNVCGETRTPAAHVYDNACDAACNVCGATRTPAAHVYDNACDADCNVCKAKRTPAAHVYDNACDKDCNVCKATRTPAAHVYDNACDADCNVCKATRTPAAHVYDNDCDADCNVCKATRTPADHKYDNACDAECNVCKATRTPADHKYDDACDKTCNECNAERAIEHKYDNACDADCNVCGEKRTPAEHKFGDWKVVTEPTKDAEGKQERICSVCEHVESEAIAMLEGGMPVAAIVVIVVVGVAGVGVGGFFVLKKFSII